MGLWQDEAYIEWRRDLAARAPQAPQAVLRESDGEQAEWWLSRLLVKPHPVAEGMMNWLSRLDHRPWWAVPAHRWDILESPEGVLLGYPEYLGWDPLAMAASAVVWARQQPDRCQKVAEWLGPATLLAAWSGRVPVTMVGFSASDYLKAYRDFEEAWHLSDVSQWYPTTSHGGVTLRWPQVPAYQEYLDQLLYGLVPHQPGGAGVEGEVPVLLALHQVPDSERRVLAGLAYKALEGRWLIHAWERIR
ncbi:hypothetical protein TPY_2426 [Sulfobacillus acidophilus TPY]|uniref:Uncharacterized protein n=1 Tax=Sulfobacillus acidophilus (strain ATCC 700253 / DSM 10332 / NAL) TaxID=679936 RepID=G8U1M3_SULAD|nr:hypothetical protein TPY_2426 [Sulfobacillus acidophilus TPY]AEW06628.1 hypothetical protein Sulac_3182 [Sulfobacillus acidophilus DSM 10332]